MKARARLLALALLTPSLAFLSCKSSTGPKDPPLQDAATAKWFAWLLVDAIGFAAPSGSASQTWSNQVMNGFVSGTATVNGSFTYSYSGTGPAVRSYNSVMIQFSKYCFDSSNGTCVTGTVTVSGTCTTTYGFSSTSYSGYWGVTGTNISVSSSFVEGQGSIVMQMYEDPSQIFAAYVTAGGTTWPVSAP